MTSYLRAKVVEWDIKLKGLKRELDGLGNTFPRVVHRLTNEYNQLMVVSNQLKRFVSITERLQTSGLTNIASQFSRRAFDQLKDLQSGYQLITNYYLWALSGQTQPYAIALRLLIAPLLKQPGLQHISDWLVVRGEGPAITNRIPEIPIFYLPRYQQRTLIDLADVLHELGHNIWEGNQTLRRPVFRAISDYFANNPNSDGLQYWQDALFGAKRVEEIFCDIYATTIGGPAYAYAFLDLVMRASSQPFERSPYVHPPHAFRADTCLFALEPYYGNDSLFGDIQTWWDSYKRRYAGYSPNDAPIFSNALSRQLITATQQALQGIGISIYQQALLTPYGALRLRRTDDIPRLLNAAFVVHLRRPKRYEKWEKDRLKAIFGAFAPLVGL